MQININNNTVISIKNKEETKLIQRNNFLSESP